MLDLRPLAPGGRVSTGLLGWYGGRLVWSTSRPRYWEKRGDGTTTVALIGIGGGQEAGETLAEAVRRESIEETASPVTIVPASRTLFCYDDGRLEDREPDGDEPAPLLVWQREVTWRDDDGGRRPLAYATAVYEGRFVLPPVPSGETVGLAFLTPDHFLSLKEKGRPLDDLLAEGAEFDWPDRPARVTLTLSGSAAYLATHWSRLGRRIDPIPPKPTNRP